MTSLEIYFSSVSGYRCIKTEVSAKASVNNTRPESQETEPAVICQTK